MSLITIYTDRCPLFYMVLTKYGGGILKYEATG